MDQVLMRAQGKALALTVMVLQRGGIVSVAEFADLLAMLSAASGEAAREEGDILALWSRMVEDAAGPAG